VEGIFESNTNAGHLLRSKLVILAGRFVNDVNFVATITKDNPNENPLVEKSYVTTLAGRVSVRDCGE
jgi:hypothetical protein